MAPVSNVGSHISSPTLQVTPGSVYTGRPQRRDIRKLILCFTYNLDEQIHEKSVAVCIMKFESLHLLPGSLFLLIMTTFAVTYGIAVWLEHVEPGFPYISDTGTLSPESCIFAQFINIAAFLLLACVYVRYLQIEEILERPAARATFFPRWVNKVAAFLGCASCVGLDIVANFQESNVLIVHMIGAFLCFFSATLYFCLQTYISRMLLREVTTLFAYCARLIISVLCIVFTIITISCGTLSIRQFTGEDIKKWRPEDGGFELHLASSISEWLLVICFCGFIASFSMEFRGLVLEGPVLRVPMSVGNDSAEPLPKS